MASLQASRNHCQYEKYRCWASKSLERQRTRKRRAGPDKRLARERPHPIGLPEPLGPGTAEESERARNVRVPAGMGLRDALFRDAGAGTRVRGHVVGGNSAVLPHKNTQERTRGCCTPTLQRPTLTKCPINLGGPAGTPARIPRDFFFDFSSRGSF